MTNYTIYHNPRCSKSRQTLSVLEEHDIQPTIITYMDTPPNAVELKQLIEKLGILPRQLLRKGEQAYKDLGLKDTSLSDQDLIDAMSKEPRLIERPIVVKGDKAIIGRPPETVLELI